MRSNDVCAAVCLNKVKKKQPEIWDEIHLYDPTVMIRIIRGPHAVALIC